MNLHLLLFGSLCISVTLDLHSDLFSLSLGSFILYFFFFIIVSQHIASERRGFGELYVIADQKNGVNENTKMQM